ncbi:MAG TPA: hypothetical protein PK677_04465 [Acidiphilium sp.]|nr:hypothetical protein [Acidiphilium sp.]HQU23606.1 hypothetical protein [Acidiphilium sp.]
MMQGRCFGAAPLHFSPEFFVIDGFWGRDTLGGAALILFICRAAGFCCGAGWFAVQEG